MQIVINIDEKIYKRISPYKDVPVISNLANDFSEITHAIANGIQLPEGHGRLIDVSEYFKKEFGDAREFLDNATTIIKADEAESEES